MKKSIIKPLNEYFSQTITGDGYNSSNGVFKVNYKAYSDLSIAVGRDPDPSLLIKDSRFKVGDIVKGILSGTTKKKISGEVAEVSKSEDGKFYIIKIQDKKDKKIKTLIPGSIEFVEDRGNSTSALGTNISSREKNAQNLKYNGGNVVWGSLESKSIDDLDIQDGELIDGPMDTGWNIKLAHELPQGEAKFTSAMIIPEKNLIVCLRDNNIKDLKEKIKAIESYCFFNYHPELMEQPEDLKCIMAIIFLEMKNEQEAKKKLVQEVPLITGKSYGEIKDEHFNNAKNIIDSFL